MTDDFGHDPVARSVESIGDASPEAVPAGPERLFVSNLALVDRVVAYICRRHGVAGADADDFGSLVKLKLLENDYEVIRKFQGKSTFATYLTTVITRLFLDDRNRRWGKWRPSAEAKRLGPVAVELESLLTRDGLPFESAWERLKNVPEVDGNRAALFALSRKLPQRANRRFLGEEAMAGLATVGSEAEEHVLTREARPVAQKTQAELARALGGLAPRDRLVLKMRFEDSFSVAEIARALGMEQKLLYRRIENLLKGLKKALEDAGLKAKEIEKVIGREGLELAVDISPPEGTPKVPRKGVESVGEKEEDGTSIGA